MPVNFPDTPNVGDTFTVGTNTFEWDGVKWVVISTDGIDVSDATAEVTDVLASETFYAGEDADIKTGTIPSKTAETFTPGTADQTITAGQYLSEDQTISGDADLTVSNIKAGVDIFGLDGTFTADATATASDILSGETAYVNGAEITGNIPSKGAETFTPGTSNQTISSGQYLSGTQTILGDADLLPENIRENTTVFGVTGTLEEAPEASYYLSFDGVDDYVDLNTTFPSLSNNNDITIEASIMRNGNSSGSRNTIISQRDDTNGFGLEYNNDGQPLVLNGGGGLLSPTFFNYQIPLNQKVFISVTYDGSNADLYINGIFVESSSVVASYNKTSVNWAIGTVVKDGSNQQRNHINANIYELRVWGSSLSSSQIQKNINGTETNLVAYYDFNDGQGTTLTDKAGNNDGTIYGATWEQ